MNSAPALTIDGVHVAYGRVPVISGMSFDVGSGETFGLIGLNGAGKTTLIKAILGLRSCNQGAIRIAGQDRSAAGIARRVAYLPELFDPPWFLSGLEFLNFSCSLYGVAHGLEKIYGVSERLSLDPAVLKNRVRTYSKGMRQKLGILATLLTECPLLILDEPMSGLDPKARAMVKDLLREARAGGRTVFLSSHILSDMNEICDRVGVLNAGALVFTGTPAELRKKGNDDNIERAFLNVIGN